VPKSAELNVETLKTLPGFALAAWNNAIRSQFSLRRTLINAICQQAAPGPGHIVAAVGYRLPDRQRA
jgi:hypothetical protein